MIRSLRQDGVFHFADGEVGDLFRWQGQWWIVVSVGEWRDEDGKPIEPGEVRHFPGGGPAPQLQRVGQARPATVDEVQNEIMDALLRIEKLLRRFS